MTPSPIELDDREFAALLAGLRLLQGSPDAASPDIDMIATDNGQFPRLSAEEIDNLCDRLNCR